MEAAGLVRVSAIFMTTLFHCCQQLFPNCNGSHLALSTTGPKTGSNSCLECLPAMNLVTRFLWCLIGLLTTIVWL